MTMPNRPDDEPLKRSTRPRPLAPSGRASTHQTSLSPAQDAWVRSRPEGVSAYLRGLVEEDMGPGMTEAIKLVNELLEQGMTLRAITAKLKFPKGTRVRWREVTGTVTAVVGLVACMICDDTSDLTDPHVEWPLLSDLVKIGGDV